MSPKKYIYSPNYFVSSGEIAQEYLDVNGWSVEEFSKKCRFCPELVRKVLAGDAPVTEEIATQFGIVLGTRRYVWLGLEQKYRERKSKITGTKRYRKYKKPPVQPAYALDADS